ncbi:MAG: RNA chaperone Hfq [Clostridia bacterium]|nr:RNA chaperone Hfq [Clostridia bacterium]MBQ8427585.1 RNA chaperone Hfq [Clostridia bacterium]
MQHTYIEALCAERKLVRVFTTNGFQMVGIIIEHDNDIIVMLCGNVKKMIFIHAVSTIEPAKNNENKA